MRDVFLMVCSSDVERAKRSESIRALCESGELRHQPPINTASEQSLARSCLIEKALQSDAEVFLFADTGLRFSVEDARRVTDRARQTRGIVGGFYPHPKMRYNLHLKGRHSAGFSQILCQAFDVGPRSTMPPQAVDAVGTGFMAIHRSVPERILKAFPQLRTPRGESRGAWFHQVLAPCPGGSIWLSSDHSFCWYAHTAGIAVEALPNVAVGHRQPWWGLGDEPESGVKSVAMSQAGFLEAPAEPRAA